MNLPFSMILAWEVWPGSSNGNPFSLEEYEGLNSEQIKNYQEYKNGNLKKCECMNTTFSKSISFVKSMPDVPIIQRLFAI